MSTVDLVQRSVLERMLRGEILPGKWLRQDDLAEQLGVSKIPVREALHRLAGVGLLRFEANRGVVVPSLSAGEANEIYELRMAVEPILLRQSMGRMSIVDLAEAEVALAGEGMTVTEANWAFHQALYQASGWSRGLAIAQILNAAVAPYVLLYTQGLGGGGHSDDQHAALLDHCRGGRADAACDVLAAHLRDAAAALMEFLTHTEP
ncbi:MAG TPA: GntR family transcriptional regulator [Acidimicrobiia bacterium]|jgi:DNA-binding GntR family transcriptional regulator|nr:GntR family transcriptional regulator [Acidimicrobiia bacterium]